MPRWGTGSAQVCPDRGPRPLGKQAGEGGGLRGGGASYKLLPLPPLPYGVVCGCVHVNGGRYQGNTSTTTCKQPQNRRQRPIEKRHWTPAKKNPCQPRPLYPHSAQGHFLVPAHTPNSCHTHPQPPPPKAPSASVTGAQELTPHPTNGPPMGGEVPRRSPERRRSYGHHHRTFAPKGRGGGVASEDRPRPRRGNVQKPLTGVPFSKRPPPHQPVVGRSNGFRLRRPFAPVPKSRKPKQTTHRPSMSDANSTANRQMVHWRLWM